MTKKSIVTLTANFKRNLESIETFSVEAEAQHAYNVLLDDFCSLLSSLILSDFQT